VPNLSIELMVQPMPSRSRSSLLGPRRPSAGGRSSTNGSRMSGRSCTSTRQTGRWKVAT